MPLPLLGIAAGILGAAGIGASLFKSRADRKRYERSRSSYEKYAKTYTDFVGQVNDELDKLHKQRVSAQETLHEAADFLVRANVKERTLDAGSRLTPTQFAELKEVLERVSHVVGGLVGGTAGGAALGGAAAASAYAAVSAFGTASTGAAISGLTGIAARNATLAWLGGGSLAAGGGGIVAGAATLANIALAPLAIIPAVVSLVKVSKQGKRIDSEIKKMELSKSKMGKHNAELKAVQLRVREVSKSLREVQASLRETLASASANSIEDTYRVFTIAKHLAKLLDMNERETDNGTDDGSESQSPRPMKPSLGSGEPEVRIG